METPNFDQFLDQNAWLRPNHGPRYGQLYRHFSSAIREHILGPGTQLPPERELAQLAGISRVTVRKAISKLAQDGLVIQRQGAGSFVSEDKSDTRLEHVLSSLTSFAQYMRQRGLTPDSHVLGTGLHPPRPAEIVALGLGAGEQVARVRRLRTASGTPMAIETSSLPADILPDPAQVSLSLYDVLDASGTRPVRAIQRINAHSIDAADATLLGLLVGSAVLQIDRTGYLANGRPIEFTTGLYRSDIYDFVAELRIDRRAV